MNKKRLPEAIATVCATNRGLAKIILPRGLPTEFKADLADTLSSLGGQPVRLGIAPGELSLGDAISFRTPEGDGATASILLIATDGDVRELKSLEPFRDVLIGGMPGGLVEGEQALLQATAIAEQLANNISRDHALDHRALATALKTVFSYLATAYRLAGNGERRWTESFWLHLDMLADAIDSGLKCFSEDRPNREVLLVFASAGLPRPKATEGFSVNHGPSEYAKIIKNGWSDIDDLELSLLGVQERDNAFGDVHPLTKLRWSNFVASRTTLGHAILSVAFHDYNQGPVWIDAWANTSEQAFFDRSRKDELAYRFFSLTNGEEREVPRLDWRGVQHVLPPVAPVRRKDGAVSLGHFKLHIEVDPGENPEVRLDCKPATACDLNLLTCTSVDGRLELEFELLRKIAQKGGKWREKPFTLSILPARTSLKSQFREGFELKLCASNPVVLSVMVIETSKSGKGQIPNFASDVFLAVGKDGSLVEPEGEVPSRDLTLSEKGGAAQLVVIGGSEAPVWIGGAELKLVESATTDWIRVFELTGQPADPVMDVDGRTFSLIVPIIEQGQVNPFLAAFMAQPVVAASEGLAEEMRLDPRGDLDAWLRDQAILADPSEHLRACLGSCLLEVGVREGATTLHWDSGLGAFSNTDGARAVTYPREIANSPAAARFWSAFQDLGLNKEPIVGQQAVRALPSTLDIRGIPRAQVEEYLAAYEALLDEAKSTRARVWAAYPFSALLFDTMIGRAKGVLLSPLHPVRLAWVWSVQLAGSDISSDPVFSKVSRSFLRFVDGEMFPEVGPSTDSGTTWVSTGLAPGPGQMFVGWGMLSSLPLEDASQSQSIKVLGLDLPFGTPSGLDQGGVSSALRDYLRVFPGSQHLRIGLAAPRGGKRFDETDDAIIAASVNLLAELEGQLPGGIRIVDSSERKGIPPSSTRVLARLQDGGDARGGASLPPFEWTTEDPRFDAHHVDVQFVEDSVVSVRTEAVAVGAPAACTSGPAFPVNRFRSWQLDRAKDRVSSFALGIAGVSFAGLQGFAAALSKLESLQLDGDACRLEAQLQLGDRMLGENAKWTITGNRNLSPAVLSAQLRDARGDIALWEWRPAFLSRQRQKFAITAISSTHPYTVLAKPSPVLNAEIKRILGDCGVFNAPENVNEVIASLGMRGVGLSSLLTMGHTQGIGAIGFNLAFRGLVQWEWAAGEREIRCVLPMDSVYPLLDLLGEGARTPDDQRRADLLLLSARIDDAGNSVVRMHPVEVKMRTVHKSTFPTRENLKDPMEQLESTFKVLSHVARNLANTVGRVLPWAAFTSLLEAAFSLRPVGTNSDPSLEARILGSIASGDAQVDAETGTILWFQVGGRSEHGDPFDLFYSNGALPGGVFVDPAAFNTQDSGSQVQKLIAAVIDDPSEEVRVDKNRDPVVLDHGPLLERDASVSGSPAVEPMIEVLEGQADVEVSSSTSLPHATPVRKLTDGYASALVSEEIASQAQEIISPAEVFLASEGIEVLVGHHGHGSMQRPVYLKLSETSLSQMNIGVVGDLGTGKTQFLKSLVYQIATSARSNRGAAPKVFIFDYKRDYSEKDYPVELEAQVLDPARSPLPINFFAIDVEKLEGNVQMERVRRANFFCDLLRRICSIGVVQRNELYRCIMDAYRAADQNDFPTVYDIFSAYQQLGKNDSVISVLQLIVDLEIFEPDPTKTRSFVQLFNRNTVLNLSGISGSGQDIVDIVATMFLDNLYTDYMKTREKKPFISGADGKSRRYVDSLVLIDEAHHAMGRDFDVLMKLMLEGREFGMGVILSSQYLSHFKTSGYDWAEALSTWVVHNVRNATARQFEGIGFRANVAEMVNEVTKLPTHWAYYRCMNNYNEGILIKGQPYFSLER